ncbi:MAG: type VII secretion-associated serine protease mycosin [Hamadaea sp.]|uniref:type VII secretion-associated serine protease mycosin n=1 Tax=Hamadaea sp. TaxID=2024425 RepID=UPI0018247E8A|nr:type VII secretion-associated serine protease mycosin [Hamadaea sp.]NUR72270.1 type VII secretion-associated serine protease mycosin [Hamadaea sp.]NUT23226.1 type VII secretion-associated serine protease mycosin [Hamadaea sp.]
MRLLHRSALVALAATAVLAPSAPAAAHGPNIRAQQWHLGFLKIAEAQQISQGEGITVAVIDTGVADHPDLSGNVLTGVDVIAGGTGNGRADDDGHGTGMAGIIAAHGHGTGNRDGALGIAPKAKILPIRMSVGTGSKAVEGGDKPVAEGIRWAIKNGAKIINISQSVGDLETLRAVNEAQAAGVLIFAAAGNTDAHDTGVQVPARYPWAVAVGGLDKSGNHLSTSITGAEVELTAPAEKIYSDNKGGIWRYGTGTSDSTAIVSGVAALVWSKFPQLSAAEVLHRLEATATDKGDPGRDPVYGFGAIDPVKALTAEVAPSAEPSKSASPLPTYSPRSPEPLAEPSSSNVGLLVALAIGGLVLLAIIALVLFLALRPRRSTGPPAGPPPPTWPNGPRP